MQMRYALRMCVLQLGDPETGKSFLLTLFQDFFSIKKVLVDVLSTSNMEMYTHTSSAGEIRWTDDTGLDNGRFMGKSRSEGDSKGEEKSAMSSAKATRRVSTTDKNTQKRVSYTIEADIRNPVVYLSNLDIANISNSTLTRFLVKLIRMMDRVYDTDDLQARLNQVEPTWLNQIKDNFENHFKKKQVFACAIWYFIRGGAIPYKVEQNAKFLPGLMKKRLKAILTTQLGRRPTSLTPRLSDQVNMLAEGFMIDRLFALCCSGCLEKSDHLKIGDPFNLEFVRELSEKGLLMVVEEDYIKALSYFDHIISAEALSAITDFFCDLIRKKTKKNQAGEHTVSFDIRTPINGNWSPFSSVFFKRQDCINELNTFTDWNIINIGKLCGLKEDAPLETQIAQLAKIIEREKGKENLDAYLIHAALNTLTESDFSSKRIVQTPNNTLQIYVSEEVEKSKVLYLEEQLVSYGSNPNAKTSTVNTMVIRVEWLRQQLNGVIDQMWQEQDRVSDVRSSCDEHYRGSLFETSLNYFSYYDCFEQEIILPGMPLGRSRVPATVDQPYKDIPHVFKTMKMKDLRQHRDIQAANETLGLPVKMDLQIDENKQIQQFEKSEDPFRYLGYHSEYDYLSTAHYQNLFNYHLKNLGILQEDDTVEKNPDLIEKLIVKKLFTKKYIENYSPVAMELKFNKRRDEYAETHQSDPEDYLQSHIEAEKESVKISLGNNDASIRVQADATNICKYSVPRDQILDDIWNEMDA